MTSLRKKISLILIYIVLHFSFSFVSSTTWHYFNSYDYYIGYNKAISYANAKADCLNEQATLVVIKTKKVQDFLENTIKGISTTFYIGLEQINGTNGFMWIDGTYVSDGYTKWWYNEPNSNQKRCVVMRKKKYYGYRWYDANCNDDAGYICQRSTEEYKCGTSGQPCKFPFEYRNVIYNSCTTIDHNMPWCSFDEEYQGHWNNCAPCPEQTAPTALPVTMQTKYTSSNANFNTTILDVEVPTNASDNDQQSNVDTTTTTIFNENDNFPNKRNLAPTTTIILIVIGIVLLLLLVILFLVVFYRRRRNFKRASAPSSDNTEHNENLYEVADEPTPEIVTNVIYNTGADVYVYDTPIVPDTKIEVKNPIYHSMETTNNGIRSSVSLKSNGKNEMKSEKVSFNNSKDRDNSSYENSYDFAI